MVIALNYESVCGKRRAENKKERRRVARNLDEDVAKDLKGKKFILLKGEESLDENGQVALERIKAISSDLTDAYILKERLRTI